MHLTNNIKRASAYKRIIKLTARRAVIYNERQACFTECRLIIFIIDMYLKLKQKGVKQTSQNLEIYSERVNSHVHTSFMLYRKLQTDFYGKPFSLKLQ